MKNRMTLTAAVTSLVLAAAALAGCSSGETDEADTTDPVAAAAASVTGTESAADVLAANKASHATDAAADYPSDEVVPVALAGGSATATGNGVTVDGATVTITAAGTYRLTGSLTNGKIVINAPEAAVRVLLDNAEVTNSSGAAIAAIEVGELIVILAEGSRNSLRDGGTYADGADVDAALFSAGDLTITGTGTLAVRGAGDDAIASKDGLVVHSGTVTVDAADDGLRGKDYVVVKGGTVTVTAAGDGLRADNDDKADSGYISIAGGTTTVAATGDGLDAATDLLVTGGALTVTSGGGSGTTSGAAPGGAGSNGAGSDGTTGDTSAKGLKAGVIAVLEAGTTTVDAADDGLHSDGAIHLDGTGVTVASGGDAVHAETALVIDGGAVAVTASVEGLEAADITLNSGNVRVVASDDGINAAGGTTTADTGAADQGGRPGGPGGGGPGGGDAVGDYSITVTGGTLVIYADGDGFDSNGVAAISGGTVVVNGPTTNGNGALDVNGTFQVSGGVLLAAGSAGMVVAPGTDSTQGWLSATLDSTVPKGTTLHVVGADGAVVGTFVTSRDTQNVVFSSSAVGTGKQYKIYMGGTGTGASVGGLAASGRLGSATPLTTVTAGTAPEGGFGGGRGAAPGGAPAGGTGGGGGTGTAGTGGAPTV